MTQRDSSGNGIAMYYNRDVQGRIVARFKNTLTSWNAAAAGDYYYGFTGSGDTPDFVRDASQNILEKNLELPGGVVMTIKPAQTGNANKQYSLPNIHGDTLLTTDAAGTNTSTGNGPANSFTYEPFGNIVSGSTFPNNADQASFGWLGKYEKFSESNFATAPIQMGARVYIPGIARFLQVDPVEGGTDNNYVYPTDPINDFDLTGLKSQRGVQSSQIKQLSNQERNIVEQFKSSGKRPTGNKAKILKVALSKIKFNEKMQGIRKSRASKDIIKNVNSGSKAINKFFTYPIPIPKQIKDGIQLKSGGPVV